MAPSPVGTYLRFLRKQSGLSQRELARILGSVTPNQVSRHERSAILPTLIATFAYEAIFQKPASEIFPGLYHTVEMVVQERLEAFENDLSASTTKGRATPVARQLEWLRKRRNLESA